jgi:hypothetical protein
MRVAQLMLKYVRLPPRGLQARIARELGVSRSTVCRDIAAMDEEVRRGLPCRLCGTCVTPTHTHTDEEDRWPGVSYDWSGDCDGDGNGVTVWDVLAGTAPPEHLPPEVLAMLEAFGSSPWHDRVEERIAAALREVPDDHSSLSQQSMLGARSPRGYPTSIQVCSPAAPTEVTQ